MQLVRFDFILKDHALSLYVLASVPSKLSGTGLFHVRFCQLFHIKRKKVDLSLSFLLFLFPSFFIGRTSLSFHHDLACNIHAEHLEKNFFRERDFYAPGILEIFLADK